jgi:hypothetical protein
MAETTELTPIKLVIVASVPALRLGLKSIFDNNSRFLVISESADIPARVILGTLSSRATKNYPGH